MKLTRGNLTRFILLPAIGSGILPVSLYPEERESFDEEEIRHIVVEAKEMAREWADRIRSWKGGQNTSSTYIGIVIEPVPDVLRDYVDLPKGVGLLLPRIAGGGPAEKAGLKDNDILVQFDGQWVINYSQLSTLIEMKGAGATVPVKILRKGVEMSFEITIEERDHQTQHPPLPKAPASPSPPGDVGALMEQIDEWIPGSVRVYVDGNQQIHVDLEDLKEDLEGLKGKLARIKALHEDILVIVEEHGDLGARTTVGHVANRTINYEGKDGRVVLTSTDQGKHVVVWGAGTELLYEGVLPEDYQESLPPEAVRLIDRLENIDFYANGQEIEVELNVETGDPVTLNLPGN